LININININIINNINKIKINHKVIIKAMEISQYKYKIYNDLVVTAKDKNDAEIVSEFMKNAVSYKKNTIDTSRSDNICPMLNIIKLTCFLNNHSFDFHENIYYFLDESKKNKLELESEEIQLEDWESTWISKLENFINHDIEAVFEDFLTNAKNTPNDLFNFRIGMVFGLYAGNKEFLTNLLNYHIQYEPNNENPHFMSIHAFILEETKDYENSLILAEKSLNICETNIWTQHVIAHILYSKNKMEECIEFLNEKKWMWEKEGNSFINKHIRWHLAITYLEIEEYTKAYDIMDEIVDLPYEEAECSLAFLGYILRVFLRLESLTMIKKKWMDYLVHYFSKLEIYTKHLLFDCLAVWLLSFLGNSYIDETMNVSEILVKALERIKENVNIINKNKNQNFYKNDYINIIYGMIEFGKLNYLKALEYILPHSRSISKLGASDEQLLVLHEVVLFCLAESKEKYHYDTYLDEFFIDFKDFYIIKKLNNKLI
jgi:hypothetical protein